MSRFRSWSQENWHPSEDDLFCYVDSELKPAESLRVKTHLEACWSCRVKTDKIRANIASFVTLLDRAVNEEGKLGFPPRGWRTFEAKISKVMSEFGRRPLLSRWLTGLRDGFLAIDLPFRLAAGLAFLGLLGVLVLRFNQTATVSASELLHNAAAAEVRQSQKPSLPVVYQKLQVRRKVSAPLREDSVTLEIWNDSTSGRFAQRTEAGKGQRVSHVPLEKMTSENTTSASNSFGKTEDSGRQPETEISPILLELGQVFRTNGIDGRKPLSASIHETWRTTIEPEMERVEETHLSDGEKGLVLSIKPNGPFVPNSIIQADLVVRVQDWHPIAKTFRVQGDGEIRDYQLTETDFDLLALNSLSPTIFANGPSPAARPIPQVATQAEVVARAPAELLASEIMVRYALHRAKACLGEPIEILTTDLRGVEVRGLAETVQRKEQLVAALQGIPLVMRLQTVAEAQAVTRPPNGAPANSDGEQNPDTPEGAVVTVRASKLPIQDGLKQYFAESGSNTDSATALHQRIAEFSSHAISLADATLADAFALRQLAQKYPTGKTQSLSASTRWLLEAMIREHLQSIQAATLRSRSLLGPVLRSLKAENEEVGVSNSIEEIASGLDWASQILQLFEAIERMERLTAFLFAGASLPEEQANQGPAKLLAAIDYIDHKTRRLVEQGSQPDPSNSATLKQAQ